MTNILILIAAIHSVETGGRFGDIVGDNGAALGPLQIHKACFVDSGVKGKYYQVTNYDFSTKVFFAYAKRYEAKAFYSNDFETLARLWNAGPGWRKNRQATDKYWIKTKRALTIKK